MEKREILKHFISQEVISCEKFGNGHINFTFLVKTEDKSKYILQKINTSIFKDVDVLQNNINTVTNYLAGKNIETIQMMKTDTGKYYYQDGDEFYRMYKFIDHSITVEKADNLEMVEVAGKSFGKFHNNLADLDGSKLKEVISHFHDTTKRFADFQLAVEKDEFDRVKYCKKEIKLVRKYSKEYSKIIDGINKGDIILHVTHNDPKINNALFDEKTRKFRTVIDLDTIMPGSVLYDFGDALRSQFTGDREDSKNYRSVVVDFEIYKAYLKGYYSEAKKFLTSREIELLPFAPFLLTMECGMRFLGDFLSGDVYFATHRENQNLDRARTQINLAISIIKNQKKLKKITDSIVIN